METLKPSGSLAFVPMQLANGTTIKNRICKAAMEENLADIEHNFEPSKATLRLYKSWGQGGAGIIMSGNVMIDPRAMTGPAGIVISNECRGREEVLRKWISDTQAGGSQFWLQINHPGRVIKADLGQQPIGPSAKAVDIGSLSKYVFAVPREMTEEDIQDIIQRFADTASYAEKYGAAGVEIHAAHGYLISQFLSPRTNLRTDKWGGSLENRSRLLFEVISKIRGVVAPTFGLGVKLNSADFQKGGFNEADATWVVQQLNEKSIDFVEISGGNVESPAMMGKESTIAREAYFLEFARQIGAHAKMPIMVTGGISRRAIVDKVVSDGKTIAGIGTALALDAELVNKWQRGEDPHPQLTGTSWILSGPVLSQSRMSQISYNMHRIGAGKSGLHWVWPIYALIRGLLLAGSNTKRYKKLAAATNNFGSGFPQETKT